MSDGGVIMDGAPNEVFCRVAELRAADLDVPQTTELLWDLKCAGWDVKTDIFDADECAAEVARALREKYPNTSFGQKSDGTAHGKTETPEKKQPHIREVMSGLLGCRQRLTRADRISAGGK